MNIRHLQLPLALALALGATGAHALGLGPIEVKSGLNQPLVAEIPILSAAPGKSRSRASHCLRSPVLRAMAGGPGTLDSCRKGCT